MSAQKIAVLGGGSFGTAIANMAAVNRLETWLWMRDPERAQQTQSLRVNQRYLPDYPLADALHISAELEQVVAGADIVFVSVPSKAFRDVAKKVAPLIGEGTPVVSTTKGIEIESFSLMSQILEEEIPQAHIGVLSGPNFAREMVKGQITGSVIASSHDDVQAQVQDIFSSSSYRIYRNSDSFGVELAGALKNIYAIVSGMAEALGTGKNTQAMLLTRSLAEMGRFSRELGADPLTFLGLAGVGDLILTCTSDQSRNFRAGKALGEGKSLEQAVADIGQAVEGINTLKTVYAKAKELDVYMPLVQGLYAIVFEGQNIRRVVSRLMTGEMSYDVDAQQQGQ
ncbi:NAD(P)H-dependent glycerol-3-phosphate dehydrogenase [Agaribacterium haliotis]|uniref:NAD(P)H-dependent glycerol-3-phosphate dehydrogenase n=1 Tax=Agaribacterium haliotis TaxID=2013869 RepID=UPI000BB59A14|nr:NAD(P)H-dependent glycerol-3-phosphate dehydrogenase [Agaribacterium haliotis]